MEALKTSSHAGTDVLIGPSAKGDPMVLSIPTRKVVMKPMSVALLGSIVLLGAVFSAWAQQAVTTVTGRVVTVEGSPVPGAEVTGPGGESSVTGPGGTFTLTGVPATADVVVRAKATVGGSQLFGLSSPTTTTPDGTTAVGDIVIDAFLGDGTDGSLVTSHSEEVVNTAHRLAGNNAAGDTAVMLDGTTGFRVGGEVMIIQIQGEAAGKYEFARVAAVSPSSVTLATPLKNGYEATNGVANVLTVPNYTDVTVSSGTTLLARPWDGATGGIVAFRVQGRVAVEHEASISVHGAGFRGGRRDTNRGCGASGGQRGESIRGFSPSFGNTAPFFGGGGAGGPDSCAGCGGDSPAGGGGYGTPGGDSVNPGGPSNAGRGGLTYGGPDLFQEIYLGSGGGESHWAGRLGGNGGGIILIYANIIDALYGPISANGADGSADSGHPSGAGSGGSLLLFADQVVTSDTTGLHADGGKGHETQPCIPCCGDPEREVGGAGGAGRVLVRARSIVQQTSPQLHGPRLWLDFQGSPFFRFGASPTTQIYSLHYNNRGDAEATDVQLSLVIPIPMHATFLDAPGATTESATGDGMQILGAHVPSIPPGASGSILVRLDLVDPSAVTAHELVRISAVTVPFDTGDSLMAKEPEPTAVCSPPTNTLCTSDASGSPEECATRQRLWEHHIDVNNPPCPEKCDGTCDKSAPCPALHCTSVSRVGSNTIVRLLDFQSLLGCPLVLTGGSESSIHTIGTGFCSHCQGSTVDVRLDLFSQGCVEDFVAGFCTSIPPSHGKDGSIWNRWNCRDSDISGQGKIITFESYPDECMNHYDIEFYDEYHGPWNRFCKTGFDRLVEMITSHDPNEITGPSGHGDERWIDALDRADYQISFENKSTASAAAQTVVVRDTLDSSVYDFSTFSFGAVWFADRVVAPPDNAPDFVSDVDLRPAMHLIARVHGHFDASSGRLEWTFTSIDPDTGLPTTDPVAGFLPPNLNSPEGQGGVLFSIQMKHGLSPGTSIANSAVIVFDDNAPIATNTWTNRIDYTLPESHVLPLPLQTMSSVISVNLSASDTGSGVQSITLYVSDNYGPFRVAEDTLGQGPTIYLGTSGHTYQFLTMAVDRAGNREADKSTGEAITTITAARPVAKCTNVSSPTDPGLCSAAEVSVDDGSYDPDGVIASHTQAPPGPYGLGETPVDLTVLDNEGLTDTCSAVITITDQESPQLVCPEATIECDTAGGTRSAFEAPHADNCPGLDAPSCTPASGSFLGLGITPITCTIQDVAGNISTCNGGITVVDTTPPTLSQVQAFPSVLWPPNHRLVAVSLTVSATDVCDSAPVCRVSSVKSSEPGRTNGSGNTFDDWQIIGPLTVSLRAERSGQGQDREYTIGVECSDSSGNKTTGEARVRVPRTAR
jgi:hypothetical protein